MQEVEASHIFCWRKSCLVTNHAFISRDSNAGQNLRQILKRELWPITTPLHGLSNEQTITSAKDSYWLTSLRSQSKPWSFPYLSQDGHVTHTQFVQVSLDTVLSSVLIRICCWSAKQTYTKPAQNLMLYWTGKSDICTLFSLKGGWSPHFNLVGYRFLGF